ncbi:MAG: VOC family protein [Anaerolineales bacterium]|nr:VOC family protein [Anaerolineales bacterium]
MSRVNHFEIPADDPERAIKFYETVFGWTIEKWDGPIEYWLIITGPEDQPGIDGGLARREDPETGVENTIDVSNLEESLENVTANGGKVIRPKIPVPGVGWMAYIKDTEGNIFGLMESDPNAA